MVTRLLVTVLAFTGYCFIVFSTEFKAQSTRVSKFGVILVKWYLPLLHPGYSPFDNFILHQTALPLALLLVVLLDVRPLGDLELPHDADQFVECLVDVHPQLGTALDVRDHQVAAGVLRLLQRHLTLVLQVTLIAHHQHGELVAIFYAQYLALKLGYLIKAGMVVEREDEQETLTGAHVLLPHGTELLLTSCIQNYKEINI